MTTEPTPSHLVLGGMKIPTTETCPECGRVFKLLDEDDADEFYNGHDCEAPEPTTNLSYQDRRKRVEPAGRPPTMRRNERGSGWTCLDCGFLIMLFDDDEHDCDVTGTSSNVNPQTDDDEEGS